MTREPSSDPPIADSKSSSWQELTSLSQLIERRGKRRKVMRVAVTYTVVSWLVLQVANSTFAANVVAGAIYPQLSQDGKQIVFSQQGAIWKMPRVGGTMTRLTDEPGFDIEPVWSPDGRWIAFLRGADFASGRLQLISAEGESKALPRVINAGDRLFFNADGKQILGKFRDQTEGIGLRWLDVESGKFGPVLRPNVGRLRYALSQDCSRIAYALGRDNRVGAQGGIPEQAGNNGPQFTISIMPAEGGTPVKLVEFHARIYDLAWTDDDQALLIVTNAGGVHNDLWHIPLDDPQSGGRKVSFAQADEDRPTLSRDSRWMLFTDNRSGPTQMRIRDMNSGHDQWVEFDKKDFGQAVGKLELDVLDADSGDPVTARVSVQRIGGKYHVPDDKLYRIHPAAMEPGISQHHLGPFDVF